MAVAARRSNRLVRVPRYPLSVELEYFAILKRIVKATESAALEQFRIHGPEIVAAYNQFRGDMAYIELRADIAWSALFFAALQAIADAITGKLFEGLTKISTIGNRVNSVNKADWQKQIRTAYGVNILANEPKLPDMLAAWERQNLDLVKSLPDQIIDQLRGRMVKAFVEGAGLKDLTKIIQERADVGLSRAELIARDQIGSLNGQLTEMRQRSIGVDEYIWRTSQDERVRPTHRVRNGKTYRWNDAGIKPGSEIRCRCIAEPVFPEEFGTKVKRVN